MSVIGRALGFMQGLAFATLNPSDKSANMTLSGGDLSFSGPAGTWAVARATIGKSAGKWYWEVTKTNAQIYTMLGIGKATASVASGAYPGSDANGYGYLDADGNKYNNAAGSAYGATFTNGDVLGFALDMDAGTLTVYKNNVSLGTLVSGLTGTYYPMVGAGAGASASTGTVNFGASVFVYAPPAGFSPGVFG